MPENETWLRSSFLTSACTGVAMTAAVSSRAGNRCLLVMGEGSPSLRVNGSL
jgi:hypothetical protein